MVQLSAEIAPAAAERLLAGQGWHSVTAAGPPADQLSGVHLVHEVPPYPGLHTARNSTS
jgi:hypothetical protein